MWKLLLDLLGCWQLLLAVYLTTVMSKGCRKEVNLESTLMHNSTKVEMGCENTVDERRRSCYSGLLVDVNVDWDVSGKKKKSEVFFFFLSGEEVRCSVCFNVDLLGWAVSLREFFFLVLFFVLCAFFNRPCHLVLFISGLMNETQALKKIWHKYWMLVYSSVQS